MNKYIVGVLAFMLIIFTACGDDSNNNTNESNNNTSEDTHNESNQTNDNDVDESATNNDKSNDNQNKNSEQADTVDDAFEDKEPEYEVNPETWSIDPIDDANEEIVLVTIDDAPDQHALEMAKTLQDLDVNAIFFVNGHLLESDEKKEMLIEIHDMGFVIGNHTYSHDNLQNLSEEEQKEEIISVSDMVEEIIGERPLFFRAPHGGNTDYSNQLADEEGMTVMNWSYGYDWEADYQTKESIIDIMVNTELLSNGANMLMHDREWTNAALDDIVTGLQDKGYDMVDPKLIKTKTTE